MGAVKPNVFISYARKDGSDESLRLYEDLQARGIDAWRDNRIDPTVDFTSEIETAFDEATHVAVIVTPDLKRSDSFVRLEISYALTQKKPIIPLVFPGGHRPITIINHTYIPFEDWNAGFALLLERLKNANVEEIDPQTRREYEIAYLQTIGQKYDHWRDLYTDMAATARIEEPKVKLKAAARARIEMRHAIHQQIDHSLDADKGKTIKTESLDELREGLRNYRRVALIGDPGAGKTTTLERLAYEYASTAAEESSEPYKEPLPLFIRLGGYTGDDFTTFLENAFSGLHLRDYLPNRIVLLLDGLNEMPPAYHHLLEAWLRDHPDVPVIVSCRKLDYVERKLPLTRIDVSPLDLERVRLFMGNYLEDEDRDKLFWALAGYEARRAWDWYQRNTKDVSYQNFFNAEDEPGIGWEPKRKSLDAIRQRPREQHTLPDMLGVVTNPFLLSIVIEIFALTGEPPRNKGDLFGRFVALLMQERGRTAVRPDRPWIADERQKAALAALAYRMQNERTGTSISSDFVLETFQQAVPEADAKLLLYFAVSASILEQSETVGFSHQLLQEYFAAYEMGEDLRRGVPASNYFDLAPLSQPSSASGRGGRGEGWWMPTGWEETALLLAGMEGDATRVVEWLTPVQPDLAYRVATESGAPCDPAALQKLYEPAPDARRSPYAVSEWGRLNHKDDTRPGVGVITLPSPSGAGPGVRALPDISWCDVPAGTFKYGQQNEPREIAYDFKIARYPVTFIQFQTFLDSGDYDDERWWVGMPDTYKRQPMAEQRQPYHNHPRDSVSWYQAVAFSKWLDAKYRELGLFDQFAALTPNPSPQGEGLQDYREMASQVMVGIARELRQRETPVEELLWECLRDRRLAGLKFRRQHPVANTTYVVDFFCHEYKLAIELDGGIHADQQREDQWRQQALEDAGIRVIRFSNEAVFDNLEQVIIDIQRAAAASPLSPGRAAGGEGWQIRLPLEWEWEYAARGRDGREYPWGNGYRVGHANCDEQEEGVGPYFLNRTTAVGLYPQGESPVGALDMSGTVWEWCMNNYSTPGVIDGFGNGQSKVLRGGSFFGNQNRARAVFRYLIDPDLWSDSSGVRLVCVPLSRL
jgi:very-short-patch-repair endonuclease/formylglycine-generating enzyme required for sulfatase activity